MQEKLPGMDPAEGIIEEFLDCLDLIENEPELKRRIPDEMYRNNFQSLVNQIKPDGNRIKTVGFTASLRGSERRFLFKSETNPAVNNKTEKSDAKQVPSDKKSSQHIEIQGTLRYADSINTNKPNNEIRVKDQSGFNHKIKVPVELMDDIVRPYWNNEVIIKGVRKQKNGTITLVGIEAVTD